ncbi:E3 ubiquitin-protein ligase TRIM71-like [Lineus longissimus]|uniref:E3 ubiquitin-protein ligase TRIM71-like n=1 Tax=Lineus longissimus TaxID=88925 RepID=UPI002B4F60DF
MMAAGTKDETVIEIKDGLSKIEEEFQCSLCLDRLQEPKILPCYHSFCSDCLEAWLRHCGTSLVCPECRKETVCNAVCCLPDDFRAKSVLANLPATDSQQKNHQCTSCDYKNSATCGCLDCDDYLCKECQFAHRRLKITKNHQVLPYKEYNVQSKLINFAKSKKPKALLFTFGGYGPNIGQLQYPTAAAVYKKNIFIADLNGIHVFDEDGQFISVTGLDEVIPTSFLRRPLMWNRNYWLLHCLYLVPEIVNLAFLSDGRMVFTTTFQDGYLCDSVLFNAKLEPVKFGRNVMKQPCGLAISSKDDILVVDSYLGCVFCFNPDGTYQKKISCKGNGEGQLLKPGYIALSNQDEIFVSDLVKNGPYWCRYIKIFDLRGYFIRQFTTSQFLFQNPFNLYKNYLIWEACQINVSDDNKIILIDSESRVVQMFDDQGKYVRTLTKREGLKYPRSLVLMEERRLICTDVGDHCVKVFTF